MPVRHPLPRTWLLTDERQGDALWPALRALRAGSGVIVRHYSLSAPDRRRLFARISVIARRRKLVLLLSGADSDARRWRADGIYAASGARPTAGLLWAATAHNRRELQQAARRGADLVLLSPLFPTRSHSGAQALGPAAFARLAKASRLPVIALGGVKTEHLPLLRRIGAYGWAGIDAFVTPKAKRIRT